MITERYEHSVSLNFELEELEILTRALTALLISGDRSVTSILKLIGMTEYAHTSLQTLVDETIREKGEV